MAEVKQQYRRRGTKPCPDPQKGVRCPLCGSAHVCAQSWRKLPEKPGATTGEQQHG